MTPIEAAVLALADLALVDLDPAVFPGVNRSDLVRQLAENLQRTLTDFGWPLVEGGADDARLAGSEVTCALKFH